MPNVKRTIASLNSLGAEMSLLKHTFYQQWTAGTLSAERLRNYAIQYYRHVVAFPRYLSALHSRCDDVETRQVLRATRHALEIPQLQRDYDACWSGIRKHFIGGNA